MRKNNIFLPIYDIESNMMIESSLDIEKIKKKKKELTLDMLNMKEKCASLIILVTYIEFMGFKKK